MHSADEEEPSNGHAVERAFPHPFSSGDSLLALTKKHNVCTMVATGLFGTFLTHFADDYRSDRLVYLFFITFGRAFSIFPG
jgi:hypothetical protein